MTNTKTTQQWQYNCHSYRKAKRLREFKRWSTYIIVSYAIFSIVMAINSYDSLINDITSQHANYSVINAVKAQELPKENISVEQQIRDIAKQANFKYTDYLVRLAYCESRFDVYALNDNGAYGIDRGIFQINSKYHKEVSNSQAFDLVYATNWTMDRINNGYQHEWACNKLIKNK